MNQSIQVIETFSNDKQTIFKEIQLEKKIFAQNIKSKKGQALSIKKCSFKENNLNNSPTCAKSIIGI